MAKSLPIRRLNQYYRKNPGFKAWVKANEQWFRDNPEIFEKMLNNPNMVNLFMDLMVLNSSQIQRKLRRRARRRT
jgi:hypothetical protein